MTRRRILVPLVTLLLWSALGLRPETAGPVTFKDITASAGIRFTQNNGAFGAKYLPEQLGSGALFLDFDGDGWQDLLFVNATNFPGRQGPRSRAALYRNQGNGTFKDVTVGSGLDVPLYGVGGVVGDYDNDGKPDVYLTAWGGGRLFRNAGGGKFVDVSQAAGVVDRGWSTGALWVDYDKDGRLDLFVSHYVEWDVKSNVPCTNNGTKRNFCGPSPYRPTAPLLFHNTGNGVFHNVTQKAGLAAPLSSGLGVAMLDFDGDGWMDVFVANDLRPNQLFRNRGDGTFVDAARRAGVAVSEAGAARAGMGVDAADYDGSGWPSLVVGNFSHEMLSLYRNGGRGLFIDEAPRSEVGRASLLSLTFGCFFFDYDLDGWPDILSANGHIDEFVADYDAKVPYRQPPHLFRNTEGKGFQEVLKNVGADLALPIVGRGVAYADIDNDGDLDIVLTQSGGPARLLRNDGGNANHAIRVELVGSASNRAAIGARIDIEMANGRKSWSTVKSGSSFASQSQLGVTFGLGAESGVKGLKVRWPSGQVTTLGPVPAGQIVQVTEGKGLTASMPFTRPR